MSDDLQARYEAIKAAQPQQETNYAEWVESLPAAFKEKLVSDAAALGVAVDLSTGHISYAPDFEEKKLQLNFDLMYCRHGKTTGNTEPRVYQGFVDEPKNHLNEVGLGQAEAAADKLDGMKVMPDFVVLSPLSRAADTGEAFLKRHTELKEKTEAWEDSAEMRFGAWDNAHVKDLPEDSIGHLFYLNQNAVVKSFEPYVSPEGRSVDGECFVEVISRMHGVLQKLNAKFPAGTEPRPLVLMYGHSMAGAALCVLTANGKQVDGQSNLGFDGKYIMPNATPVYLHREGGMRASFMDKCSMM